MRRQEGIQTPDGRLAYLNVSPETHPEGNKFSFDRLQHTDFNFISCAAEAEAKWSAQSVDDFRGRIYQARQINSRELANGRSITIWILFYHDRGPAPGNPSFAHHYCTSPKSYIALVT